MYTTVFSTCVPMHHQYSWCLWRAERAPDPQTLELQVVVNTISVLGIEPKTSAGAANTLNHWIISPAPLNFFFVLWIFGPPVEFMVRGNEHLVSYRRKGGVRLTEHHWPPAILANQLLLLFFKNASILFLFICVQVFCLCICVHTIWVPQKSTKSLVFELQVFVRYCVDTGNRTRVLCKSSKYSLNEPYL